MTAEPRVTHRRLLIAGWLLYLISWVTPGSQGRVVGAWAFIAAPRYGTTLLLQGASWSQSLIGLSLLFGWTANFSLLAARTACTARSRWTRSRWVWIIAPWVTYAAVMLLPAPAWVRERVASSLYFYPWAAGIALIHIANIQGTKKTSM